MRQVPTRMQPGRAETAGPVGVGPARSMSWLITRPARPDTDRASRGGGGDTIA